MPKGTQGTVEIVRNEGTSLSKSDTATIKSCFPASPVGVSEPLTIAANRLESPLHKYYQASVLDASVTENSLFGETINMNYELNGAPKWTEVPTTPGIDSYPASAWVPNPVSPGEGSINPADKGAAAEGYGTTATDSSYGVYATGDANSPSASSAKQSQAKLGDFLMGKSPATR